MTIDCYMTIALFFLVGLLAVIVRRIDDDEGFGNRLVVAVFLMAIAWPVSIVILVAAAIAHIRQRLKP